MSVHDRRARTHHMHLANMMQNEAKRCRRRAEEAEDSAAKVAHHIERHGRTDELTNAYDEKIRTAQAWNAMAKALEQCRVEHISLKPFTSPAMTPTRV